MMNAWQCREVARVFYSGGLIAYPTEAVFGLGCDPVNPDAVARLLLLKQRSLDKGLILLASHISQLEPWVDFSVRGVRRRVLATWPGPVTWCVPKLPDTPNWISGRFDTIAVRVTAHPAARLLCDSIGSAIVSTSLNRAGHSPARSSLGARSRFPNGLDYIINDEVGKQPKASEIRDALTGYCLRSG